MRKDRKSESGFLDPRKIARTTGVAVLLGMGLITGIARAGERRFVYNYETDILADGAREMETYSTYRFGRDHFYSALYESVEYEMGLGGGVQTSLYLNFDQELEADAAGNVTNNLLMDGVANEWIFKLADGDTDPLGFALYAEPEFKPDELELETKVIVDKRMGDWEWAFNLTTEPEYHWIDNTSALNLIPSLGVCYFLTGHFSAGLEAQDWNVYSGDNWALSSSILSLGPVFSYAGNNWWTTLTILPQITDLRNGGLNFTEDGLDSQRWQVRLGTSFSI